MEAIEAIKSLQPRQQNALLETMIANLEPPVQVGQLVDALEQEKARRADLGELVLGAVGGSGVLALFGTMLIGLPYAILDGGYAAVYGTYAGAAYGAAAALALPFLSSLLDLRTKAVEYLINHVKQITPAGGGDVQAGQVQVQGSHY